MGIPSFYKHLIQTIGGLTAKHRPSSPQVFALDLNCAIYHCARNPILGEYTHEGKVAWENRLIQQVIGYIKDMTALVKPTEILYIAVDGVAPMAKIKQQRARRFKSSVLAAEEAKVTGKIADAERWNTNAITPGTQFMERLGTALRAFKVAGIKVIVSPADEAGEGEQKIMAWLRLQSRMQPHIRDTVVYGLDADLIVLALLEHARSGATVDLFREETEFGGGVKRDALGAEQYLYLNCGHLATALTNQYSNSKPKQEFLRDFVGIMNLMGNDFVPHGMALKINDEGIEHVLEAAKSLTEPLVTDNFYNPSALATLLETLAAQEERWILRGIRRKLEARIGASASSSATNEARALAVMNDRPVEWAAEKCMVEQRRVEGQEKPSWFFRPSWRGIYRAEALDGADVGVVVRTYCQALSWTLRYYVGELVDMDWYYPWHLPPLLSDIALGLRKDPTILTTTHTAPTTPTTPLKPLEQLAMVLPATSFDLLPREMHDLPQRFPWAWPIAWPVFSLGRRFLWECEPLIPLIRPAQIRKMLAIQSQV